MKRELICIGCPMGCQLTATLEGFRLPGKGDSAHGRGRELAATGRRTKDSAFQAEERSAPPSLF